MTPKTHATVRNILAEESMRYKGDGDEEGGLSLKNIVVATSLPPLLCDSLGGLLIVAILVEWKV